MPTVKRLVKDVKQKKLKEFTKKMNALLEQYQYIIGAKPFTNEKGEVLAKPVIYEVQHIETPKELTKKHGRKRKAR